MNKGELQGSFILEDPKIKAQFRNKKILEYLFKFKWLLIISVVFTLSATLIELIGPIILGKILDGQLAEGIGAPDKNRFYLMVFAYFASIAVGAIISYFGYILFSKLSNALTTDIRKDTFRHVVSLPVQFFDKYAIGKIVNRITSDTKDIRMLFQLLFSQILVIIIRTFGLLLTLFIIDWRLGLISIIATPVLYIAFMDFFNKSLRYQGNLKKYRSEMNANLAENIQNMEVIQAFNKEKEIYDEFSNINEKWNREGWKMATLWGYSSNNFTGTLVNIIIAIVIIVFGRYFLNGIELFSIGTLYVFIDYNAKLYNNINALMNQAGQLQSAKSAADQIFELQRVEPFEEGKRKIENMKGNIKFDHVNFAYKDDEYVIHDLSLDIPKGTSAAFVGHTGSGKSTIMNLIYKFYNINEGEITIDGIDIHELDMVSVRSEMAIVFQNPYIFQGTIYENIALFDPKISKNDAELALILVGGENILQREGGIDSLVGESGSGFSAGEKQIISFARAMVRDPKILVLDEATANVDTETENLIQFGLDRLKKGRTTLLIAHRLSTIKDSDRIYLLEKGRLIEEGTHDELMEMNGKYASMYRN
ncbi:MAG: ABC transporter ATP-binding protein [Helcococcus sp.]|nr:ABC transporter ATP-binding protein [Helcococcus sp.]